MIRPLTIATFLLACGSGLYLYQSKHEVQVLDRTIERSVRDTNALREQSRLIAAEWTMLNDPERLRQFADAYLHVKSISPTQFTSLADLNNRLPPPHIEAPTQGMDDDEATPSKSGPQLQPEPPPATVAEEDLPVPPIPTTPPTSIVASMVRPADVRLAIARPAVAEAPIHSPVAAETRVPVAAETRSPEARPVEPRPTPRVAEARTQVAPPVATPVRPVALAAARPQAFSSTPVSAPPAPRAPINVSEPVQQPMQALPRPSMVASQTPYGGSLLGMARGSMPPAPRPTPVTYNSN